MDESVALMKPTCPHDMALWTSHWEWWCGNCGITFPEYSLINFPGAHAVGDYHA